MYKIISVIILTLFSIFLLKTYVFVDNEFWGTKFKDQERRIFENSQSYVQGKTIDLAARYSEYQRGTEDERTIIKNLVVTEFSDFDKEKINSPELKSFLVECRGY